MSVFGVADCLGSFSNGWIAKKMGKRFVIVVGSCSAFIGFITSTIAAYNDFGHNNLVIEY